MSRSGSCPYCGTESYRACCDQEVGGIRTLVIVMDEPKRELSVLWHGVLSGVVRPGGRWDSYVCYCNG